MTSEWFQLLLEAIHGSEDRLMNFMMRLDDIMVTRINWSFIAVVLILAIGFLITNIHIASMYDRLEKDD